jgi:LysM repeat protein
MYGNVMNKFKWGGIEKKDTIIYTVKSDDTKESIAKRFNVSEFELSQLNPPDDAAYTPGSSIKIAVPNPLYLDENILRMTMNLRSNFARLVEALIDEGKKEEAKKAIDRCIAVMPRQTVPYNIFMVRFPEYYYKLDEKEKAGELARQLANIYKQEMKFNTDMLDYDPGAKRSTQQAMAVMQELIRVAAFYKDKELEDELNRTFDEMRGGAVLQP